jgi:hypothetical protein
MLDLSFYYFITYLFLVSRVEEERWWGIDYIFFFNKMLSNQEYLTLIRSYLIVLNIMKIN